MKNIKRFIASLLALLFLSPALVACQQKNEAGFIPPENVESENSTDSVPPETDEDSPENSSPIHPSPTPTPTPKPDEPDVPTAPAPTPIEQATYLQCTGDSVYLRSGAGTNYAVIGNAKKGETYAIIGKTGNWYETYYRGKKVYISASYVAVTTLQPHADDEVESVLNEGYKLLGVPYVYGAVRFHDGNGKLLRGFTAQKFDCSSLVQYVFYKGAKTLLQVNTRTQVLQGKYVAKNDLQRGDCLFFTNSSRAHLTGIERVGHVAIYLGDNYILHTASDYARIEKISASRWKYYIEARRFI